MSLEEQDVTEESSPSEDTRTVEEMLQEETSEETTEETETPEETEETTEETEESEETEETEEPPKEDKTVPLKALQREREKRRKEAERARELEERIAALESRPKPQEEIQEPKLADYDSLEDYNRAMVDFTRKTAEATVKSQFSAEMQRQQEADKQRRIQEQENKIRQNFHKQIESANAKDEKFEDDFNYVNELSMENIGLERAIVLSDIAPKLISYLAKNPSEAERITNLSPEAALKAIGAIEDKMKSPPKPKNVTKAPAPVKPVGGNSKTANIKYRPNMSEAERKEFYEQAEKSGMSVNDILDMMSE